MNGLPPAPPPCVQRVGTLMSCVLVSSPGQALCLLLTWYWVTGANFSAVLRPPSGYVPPTW